MKKVISSSVMLFMATATVCAGGLVTNSNQSAAFMRNPARDALTEVDAAYYNPAGVAFMSNGFHFGFSNQAAFQQRNVTGTLIPSSIPVAPGVTVPVDFSSTMQNREYKGTINSPVIPSIDFAYVTDRWSISSHFGVPGGGGSCEYADGLPMFDAMIRASIFQKVLTASGNPTTANTVATNSAVASSFTGKSFLFGWQVGGSYKVTDYLSFAVGARLSYYMANYNGKVNFTVPGSAQTTYNLDCDQSGLGFAPILGVNYKKDGLSVAVKYEFRTSIEAENDTKEFPDAFETVCSLSRV